MNPLKHMMKKSKEIRDNSQNENTMRHSQMTYLEQNDQLE